MSVKKIIYFLKTEKIFVTYFTQLLSVCLNFALLSMECSVNQMNKIELFSSLTLCCGCNLDLTKHISLMERIPMGNVGFSCLNLFVIIIEAMKVMSQSIPNLIYEL